MRKLLFFIVILVSTNAFASHIVGGEFELLHINGERYRLNLILYFDLLNGNPGARDSDATVRIFRKIDNKPIADVFIPFILEQRVDYFQPQCSNGEIITNKLTYSTEITLSAEIYNDPGGYYVVWERCCRNYTITNINSEDPQNGGTLTAGQTFYLEFPPVVKNGQPFINSSPQLFPPLNDYACPNRPYWVDFAGIDVDDDSLVYSLVTPLNTVTADAIPPGGPHPGPYPSVAWQRGFGLDNIMGGAPDLKITNKGFLTVTPTLQGLFVFAVKCEEYRDGVKIGEVIRDFQMLVLDYCPVADPPLIKGKKLSDQAFTNIDNMSVTFPNTTTDDQRCIQVEVSDPDALKVEDNFSEIIWLKVIPIGFETERDLSAVLPTVSNVMLTPEKSVESFDICFDRCPLVSGAPYTLGIIAFDDACALPLSDTLRININIEPPTNTPAYFLTADPIASIKEGDDYQLVIEGRDNEQDSLTIDIITDGFVLADAGMSFTNTLNADGKYTATFNWVTGCDIYDFTEQTDFIVKLIINDQDYCNTGAPDTLTLNLNVILPPNTDPVISTDLPQLSFLHYMNTPIDFNVFGLDTDGDELEMYMVGDGFNPADYGIDFQSVNGVTQVKSAFSWAPGCANVNPDEKDVFKFLFVLNDIDKCKFPNYDSLEVKVTLLKPNNTSPTISFTNLNPEVNFESRQAGLSVGQKLKIEVIAEDAEKNGITLDWIPGDNPPVGISFSPSSGAGRVSSVLEWDINCENLAEVFKPKSYELKFTALDDECFTAAGDTVSITIDVEDIKQRLEEFIPTNVFTPNEDGVNDTYFLPELPLDDCTGKFLSFRVFNRWGNEVYVTIDRNFVWEANGLESGVYYYVIEYSNKKFNGQISILY